MTIENEDLQLINKPLPNGDGRIDTPAARLEQAIDLAAELLLPNPEALASTGQQLSIPVVSKPGALEFFRTHPSIRLTLRMVCPRKGEMGALSYAVTPTMEGILARYRFEPYVAVLYPIVIAAQPLLYKLVMMKPPAPGKSWDNYNLSKKLTLDRAVDKWTALRSIKGGYEAVDPDEHAKFPEPVFPDWVEGEWLNRSLGVADLVLRNEDHPVFKEIRGI